MFYTYIRFILIGLLLALGVVFHYMEGLSSAWYLYVAALVLIATHFLFGHVWVAFAQLKKGDIDKSERLLSVTTHPNWLLKGHRAYYFFTKGMIELQRKQMKVSEQHLQRAVDLGLRTNNDKALANLNLAHIAFVEKRFQDAHQRLQTTKTFNSNDLMIKENVHKMEIALQPWLRS